MREIKLSIVIPLYNTPINYFESCLQSILDQSFPKHFLEVIIVDDCSTVDYSEIYNKFEDLPLKVIRQEINSGSGVARQIGIDNARGSYITFIDSDDELFDNRSLYNLYNAAVENPFHDIICGKVLEQLKNSDVFPHIDDYVWCFAKLFKRDFLIKNNIKFNNTRANEDNSFCTLCSLLTNKIIWIEDFVYFWKYQPTSITRRNNQKYEFSEFKSYIVNMIWVYEQLVQRNKQGDKKCILFYNNVWIRLYFHLIKCCQRKYYDRALETLQLAKEYYDKVFILYKKIGEKYFSQCYSSMFSSSISIWEDIPKVSYSEFEYRVLNNQINELDYRKYER